jgi:hypothetical protein
MRLLRHFVLDSNLDLETIKIMIANLEQSTDTDNTNAVPTIETEESEVLQEELRCMIIDARDSYSMPLDSL